MNINKSIFKAPIIRDNTKSSKYKLREKLFGTEDVLPAWVADMDIDTPDFVFDAVKKRLEHKVVGYEEFPKSAFMAQAKWIEKQHQVSFELDDFFYSPSVVASINMAIEAFSKEGDKVVVQTPVYPPFFKSITTHKREVVYNPLKQKDDGSYTIDIADLESKIDESVKLLLLCSPHNPVGRVWRRDELKALCEVCIKHNIVVFSDEVHSDLVYSPNKHIPFASISQKAKEITVSAMGVGKSFNMAGFSVSSVIIQSQELKKRFLEVYKRVHFGEGSVLSHVAFEAAYKNGYEWIEELKEHLYENYLMLERLCEKYDKFLKLTPIEGTYLAWIDCRGLNLSNKELREFFVKEAKLGLNAGLSFGREGSGFMRLNFGVSQDKMVEIIKRMEYALDNRLGK